MVGSVLQGRSARIERGPLLRRAYTHVNAPIHAFNIVSEAASRIIHGDGLFNYIGGAGRSAPVPAISTHLAAIIKVVEGHKAPGEIMVVRGHRLLE